MWINLSGSKVLNSDGSFKHYIAQIQNITPRKRALKELEEQKSRIENILIGTNAGTWEWNVQTGETIFNERWAEMIGYTLDELQPVSIKTWENFAHPKDLKVSGQKLQACFDKKSPYYNCECRMKHKDGHWVWVLDRGKVITWTEDGQPLMMFGTHTDITEN
ncbi:PAS domain-containing protein [Belliella pelovolcani]|uniref:PAS domain-containing protein n=1 Tax=Belliella pelovolcani TaxID=529505 RepID=UPI003919491B